MHEYCQKWRRNLGCHGAFRRRHVLGAYSVAPEKPLVRLAFGSACRVQQRRLHFARGAAESSRHRQSTCVTRTSLRRLVELGHHPPPSSLDTGQFPRYYHRLDHRDIREPGNVIQEPERTDPIPQWAVHAVHNGGSHFHDGNLDAGDGAKLDHDHPDR